MKKWQIITAVSAAVIITLAVGGSIIYNHYVVPSYIEPVVEKFSNYVKEDSVLEALYEQAVELHIDGVIEDDIYSSFISAYNKHMRDDNEFAHDVLNENDIENDSTVESTALSAKYASHRVGVEMIQVNDNINKGKASVKYSSERTSDRTKVEDIVEAEKILSDSEEAPEETEIPEDMTTAYEKLRINMTASDLSAFGKIISKLDIPTLRSFADTRDKDGLKLYLQKNLDEDEYKQIVNLGYKYAHLFMED